MFLLNWYWAVRFSESIFTSLLVILFSKSSSMDEHATNTWSVNISHLYRLARVLSSWDICCKCSAADVLTQKLLLAFTSLYESLWACILLRFLISEALDTTHNIFLPLDHKSHNVEASYKWNMGKWTRVASEQRVWIETWWCGKIHRLDSTLGRAITICWRDELLLNVFLITFSSNQKLPKRLYCLVTWPFLLLRRVASNK